MVQTLWHGSESIIRSPAPDAGGACRDFGRGFYCTVSPVLAREWSAGGHRGGLVSRYELDLSGLAVLNLNEDRWCILHWLAVLLDNREFDIPAVLAAAAKEYLLRTFAVDYGSADLIIGYRADDSRFSFAQDFLNGALSYRQLCIAVQLDSLGQQVVVKSETAFDRISFQGFEAVPCRGWHESRMRRDLALRRGYADMQKEGFRREDIYITQILREEMKADDPRLRQALPG